jgi:molybdate transport repressor ModE-like protein
MIASCEMRRRHKLVNIPTEIVRTLVTISEEGSLSKAGERLGLSQPAVSAQIKKLQLLVGGPVVDKVAGGVALTERGHVVLGYARKLLQANDQILSIGGVARDAAPLRVGLTDAFVDGFFRNWAKRDFNSEVHFYCDQPGEIKKALTDGYVHVACLIDPPSENCDLVEFWEEDYIWIRSQNFVMSAGAPIPIVCWPGTAADLPALAALESAGAPYRVVFTSKDSHARLEAVASGLGIMGVQQRQLHEPLVRAIEYYLPPLRRVPAGICVSQGFDRRAAAPILRVLKAMRQSG